MSNTGKYESSNQSDRLWIDWGFLFLFASDFFFASFFVLNPGRGFGGPYLYGPVTAFVFVPISILYLVHQVRLVHLHLQKKEPFKHNIRKLTFAAFAITWIYNFLPRISSFLNEVL